VREFQLNAEQTIKAPIDRVFSFFADAGNLDEITPKAIGFRILTPRPIEMRAGTLIDYSITLHGLPIRWRTRINVWEPGKRFVDEQLSGPYRLWVHEHTFEPCGPDNAWTLVCDHVRYAVPGGPGLERAIEGWFVRPRLEEVFVHRKKAIVEKLSGKG
jgi:ligand-binding SRPBCC domain-containing protein